jgi:thiol-disulfide isomerase/thioredoxin
MKHLFSAALALASVVAYAQQHDFHADPKFQKEIAAANAPHQSPEDQLGHWKKANKIAGGACIDCLGEMAGLQFKAGQYKDSIASASALEALATLPRNKAYAQLLRGSSWFRMGNNKPKPEQLQQADAAYKSAIASDPSLLTAYYMDGRALALLNRDEDAHAMFVSYVQRSSPTDLYRTRAQHFADNPALARAKMAPPFTVTTSDGKQFSLDEMGGRVVLVDFWATWCGPCNRELPHIKKIAQEFSGQPFVLISVSWDSDPGKWQAFVEKNGMSWNQFRDSDHLLSTTYGVDAIPHYFTIDADGVLQDEQIGSGSDIEGRLKKLVARARQSNAVSSKPPADNRSGN